MSKRRGHGDGAIDARGENTWRLRYRIDSRRFTKTVRGTKCEAQKALRELLHAGDEGTHVAPEKQRVAEWIEYWIGIGCPGQQRRKVGRRAIARYAQLLRHHVAPAVGKRPLQQLRSTELDELFEALHGKVSERTRLHVYNTLGACLGNAVRARRLIRNPINDVAKKPDPGEADHGAVLDADQLRELVAGFKGSSLYPIVAVAVGTGARRNEILGLQWTDLDAGNKTLRIERAVDEDAKHGLKGPKKERHKRTIAIDDDLVALLLGERERHLRIAAGVPDGAAVDLSLVKLPSAALMFPSPEGKAFDFTRLRDPHAVTRGFSKRALKIGFKMRFHDIRGSHETALLDAGVPVHVVADRCGHDPAELMRSYAKRTKKADVSAAAAIGKLLRIGE